jgi:hypothetical protein
MTSSIDPDLVRLAKRLKLGPILPTLPERLVPRSVNSWPYAGGSADECGTSDAAYCSQPSIMLSPNSAAE